MTDLIDIDALERFMDENPLHLSPKEELESIFDYVPAKDPCLIEATHLLDNWDRNNTPLDVQRAQADFFFLKWDFVRVKTATRRDKPQ